MKKMSKFRISKEESEKGWAFDLKSVQIDLFHLLSLFLAEEKFASILTGENDPLWMLASYGEPEMTRILIHSAVIGRVVDDRENRFLSDTDSYCGDLVIGGKATRLNLREAFNKIIHASKFELVINESDCEFAYIEPTIHLRGSQQQKSWEAKLDIIAYIREFNRNIVDLEKDRQFT